MKKLFLDSSIKIIKKYRDCTSEEMELIIYGLEGIYLTITKAIIIFGVAFLLGIFKEVIILLISYNVIRSQAFGIHASKSIYCLISSLATFIGGVYICKYLAIPLYLMVIISVICVILLFLYAPADTEKRPIVNKKKRFRFKFLSVLLGIIYTVLVVIYRDISNYLLVGMVIEVIMILPITYRLFNMSYDNYKNYGV